MSSHTISVSSDDSVQELPLTSLSSPPSSPSSDTTVSDVILLEEAASQKEGENSNVIHDPCHIQSNSLPMEASSSSSVVHNIFTSKACCPLAQQHQQNNPTVSATEHSSNNNNDDTTALTIIKSLMERIDLLESRLTQVEKENDSLRSQVENQHIQHMKLIDMVMTDQKSFVNMFRTYIEKSSSAGFPASNVNSSEQQQQPTNARSNRNSFSRHRFSLNLSTSHSSSSHHLQHRNSISSLISPFSPTQASPRSAPSSITHSGTGIGHHNSNSNNNSSGSGNNISPRAHVQPKTIGIFTLQQNSYTASCVDFLQNKFSSSTNLTTLTVETVFDPSRSYDLVLVVFFRNSGKLDHIVNNSDLVPFSAFHNCWLVCAHGNVWDDKCDYKELIGKYNCKGILQFNMRDGIIQMKHSPLTIQSMKLVEEMILSPNLTASSDISSLTGKKSTSLFNPLGVKLWK